MVCRAENNYSGNDRTGPSFTNWSGDVGFHPATLRVPKPGTKPVVQPTPPPYLSDRADGLASLVEAVADATDKGQSIHAIGSGWAFEDCAKSDEVMVSLVNLNSQLQDVLDVKNDVLTQAWIDTQNDPASPNRLVHFEAGIRIAALCEQLDGQGLAMPTLGGSNGQALAGAVSTSTHGGDWQKPPFPDVVRAIHLVSVGGQEWWIEPETNPITRDDDDNAALKSVLPCKTLTNIVRDDRIFDAVRVACGRFGVIYSFVLEVRRQFRVVQLVNTPSGARVLDALRRGQGTTAVFGPLFSLLDEDPIPADFDDAQGEPYFLEILFNSQRPSDVWVRRRWETVSTRPDIEITSQGSKLELAAAIIEILNGALLGVAGVAGATVGATATAILTILTGGAAAGLGPALGAHTSVEIVNMVAELDALLATGNPPFGSVLAAGLTAAWRVPGVVFLIPQIQGMVIEDQLRGQGTVHGGRRNLHYLVTTGTRADSDQEDFRSDSIELVFDATTADYLDFLDEILPVAPLFQQAGYVSLRPSLRSSALLSMHNVAGPRAISIEIASVKNLIGNAPWLAFVHGAAIRHNGRPHWGQYNKLDALGVAMLYGDSLNQWREGLLAISGTSTVFSNDFTRQRGLEPTAIVREVTAVRKSRRGSISHLCSSGASWSPVPVRQAIREIRSGAARYFVRSDDRLVPIRVVAGRYLRTVADTTEADNLDNLPHC